MKKYHTHVCLISAQATPNLTPLLDEKIKPQRVVMFVSHAMQDKAQLLEEILKPRGIKVERVEIGNPNDIHALQNLFIQFIQKQTEQDIAFNITGGTKPMAIAAQEVARMNGNTVFYVDIATGGIYQLSQPEQPPPELYQIKNPLKLNDYLHVHGFSSNANTPAVRPNRALSDVQRDFVESIIKDAITLKHALPALNHAIETSTSRNTLNIEIQQMTDAINLLFDKLIKHQLITKQGKGYAFKDLETRKFLHGDWLEAYVYDTIKPFGLQDCAMNVTVESAKTRVKNELDIACIHNNKLWIMECKTKKFSKGESDEDNGVVYKLDSLKDLGGLQTKRCLISYLPIIDATKKRAAEDNILVLDSTKLKTLEADLKKWLAA